ncbi:YcbK family protein [Psychromonas aquimarina]|uniref:YcbK family protein n=1 Tax=Psychromonas aquimarina TaxID=444919 RepID=UPI00040D91E0|nr:YcbK family protein [Psychromonas aquimarina]
MTAPIYSRRKFLQNSLFVLGAAALPSLSFASLIQGSPRALQMSNIHTGESLHTQYFDGRQYQLSELQKINHLCRDFRQNEAHNMDKTLFDQISAIQQIIGCDNQVQIISGFRSSATNKMLSERSEGVAKKSLHMLGKAIDFRIEGVPLADVRKAALSLKTGGVGYYPKSNFIHIDSGRFRSW